MKFGECEVFQLRADGDHFAWLWQQWPEGRSDEWLPDLRGQPVRDVWKCPPVKLVTRDRGKKLKVGDYPAFGLMPTFTPKARAALEKLIGEHGEFLSYSSEDGEFFFFNVTRVLDVVDRGKSDLIVAEGVKNPMDYRRLAFFKERIGDTPIFRVPEFLKSRTFVTSRFKERVEEAGLLGFKFRPTE